MFYMYLIGFHESQSLYIAGWHPSYRTVANTRLQHTFWVRLEETKIRMHNIYTFSVWGPWTWGRPGSCSHRTVTSAMLLCVLTVFDQNVTREVEDVPRRQDSHSVYLRISPYLSTLLLVFGRVTITKVKQHKRLHSFLSTPHPYTL